MLFIKKRLSEIIDNPKKPYLKKNLKPYFEESSPTLFSNKTSGIIINARNKATVDSGSSFFIIKRGT